MSKKKARPKPAPPKRTKVSPGRSGTSPILWLNRWLAGRERWVLAVLLLLALGIRTAYLVELQQTAAFRMHEWPESDMNFFHYWGEEIAAGDWLTDQELHPDHQWHRLIGDRYLTDNPEKIAELAPGGQYEDARRALWNRWYGGKRYHQEPLYPYVIGVVYSVFGPNPNWILFGQALLGALSVGLVWLTALRLFGRPVALVSGVLALLCGPMLFYDGLLLRTTPLAFTGLLLVYLVILSISRNTYRYWLVTGIAFGAALALKTTFGLLWLGAVGLLAYSSRRTPGTFFRTMSVFVAGTFLLLAPFMVRNMIVGVSPLAFSSVNSLTFVLGNSEDYHADLGASGGTRYLSEILGATDGAFGPSVVRTLKTHPDLMSYIRQVTGKIRVLWHWFEHPNNVNYYFYKLHSNTLRLLPVTFLMLSPLALVGLFLAWPTRRKRVSGSEGASRTQTLPLYILIASLVFTLLIALGLSRYRLPLMVALIPFAAFTVVQVVEWLAEKKVLQAGVVALVVGALAITWTARPLPGDPPLTRPSDHVVSKFYYFDAEIRDAETTRDLPRITELLERALSYEPESIQRLVSSQSARSSFEVQMAGLYGGLHTQYARALHSSGRPDEAAYHRERGEELGRVGEQGQAN